MALAPTDVASIEETTAIRLVTAHRCGDPEAFAEIVREHYASLLATARRRLRDPEDAQDAVQETLLRALLAMDRFGGTGDWRLGAWLHTILVHVCTDIPMRRKPTTPLSDSLIETHPDERAEPTSDHVALAAVRRAIEELPEPQRLAFELRLVDGRPYDEVAGALGITEVNARARVRRARTKLQHALKGTSAIKGAWAAVPLVLTAPVRAALRRVFAGAQDSACATGSQALASGAATASSTVSAIATTPVGAGMQLIAQVSATPLGQAVVASATNVPAKGSVVLGIVASLATAGGLAAPAAIGGSGGNPATSPPALAASAPAASLQGSRAAAPTRPTTGAATSTTFAPKVTSAYSAVPDETTSSSTPSATSPATGPSTGTSGAGSTSPAGASAGASGSPTGGAAAPTTPAAGTTPVSSTPAPTWLPLAESALVYRISNGGAPPGTTTTPGSSGPGGGSSLTATVTVATPSSSATSSSTPPTVTVAGTGTAGAGTAGSGAAGAGTTPASGTTTGASALALPFGSCTGVTGFPGVTAPTSVPPLSSAGLSAILSTGSLNLTSAAGSPAFEGTALVTPTSSGSTSAAPVHVKVGTCLAQGGSILAVDLTGTTGDEVQLVGSLVAQPSIASTGSGVYLFRGSVTQIAGAAGTGGMLPWGLPQTFVAEVQVGKGGTTGALTVVFVEPQQVVTGTVATSSGAASGGSGASAAPGAGTQGTSSGGGSAGGTGAGTTTGTTTSATGAPAGTGAATGGNWGSTWGVGAWSSGAAASA